MRHKNKSKREALEIRELLSVGSVYSIIFKIEISNERQLFTFSPIFCASRGDETFLNGNCKLSSSVIQGRASWKMAPRPQDTVAR
ncbi:hypothetical protein CEXT_27661 [Caerostris extrusa]|uniref:Uncharacterized protein n=1 Tax=Caerostris extrusa TaxID=172846 RepID=A0AAV4UYS0_CAEEX|nr:hypothetical protein CEXT_27661 [Caerostris extrusa]